jgi:UrcA family protein
VQAVIGFSDPAASNVAQKIGNTMRTSQIIITSLLAGLTVSMSPALAEQSQQVETIAFELDLSASETELYKDLSEQARRACIAGRNSSSVLARANVTRKCQKRLVANVVEALNNPTITKLAKADGIEAKIS